MRGDPFRMSARFPSACACAKAPEPMATKPLLVALEVRLEVDDDADTSFIDTYNETGHLDPSRVVDRQARGDRERGTYRYFVAAMGPSETGNPESVEADYQRLEAFNAGSWHMVGIYAKATIATPNGDGTATLQTLRSGGLWGIESDSDPAYLRSVAEEEVADFRVQLRALGIRMPPAMVAAALATLEA
jgi:hypothetical protein